MGEQLLKSSANFMEGFDQLLKESSFVDCSLVAEGQTLKAHRAVLSAASAYFELLFTEGHEMDPVIIFTNIRFNELEAVLRLIYRGEVEVSEDRLAEFLNVLTLLQINGVDCNELVVRKKNVTTCDKSTSFITFEASIIPETSSVCEKVEDEVCVQHLADNKHTVQHYPSWEGSSQTLLASDSNVLSTPPFEVKSCLGDFENHLSRETSEPSVGYEFSCLETDIDIKDEEINLNLKIEKDDLGVRIEDETTLEDVNDYNARDVHPVHDDAELQFEDVLRESAVTNIGNAELFNCPSCDFQTSDRSHFNVHMCHVNSQFELSHCSLSTKLYRDANIHEFKHLKGKPFKCPVCPYTCRSKNHLKSHMSAHTGEKPFKCPQCTYGCSQKGTLINHMRTHTVEKPFKCSQCSYACNKKYQLIGHIRTHTGEKPFQCSQCSFTCNKKSNLLGHMRRHTGEKPFKCLQCSYACSLKPNLTKHMGTHTGEKPFKCSKCTYACGQKHHLINHMRTHTGEKPFKCSQCTYSCTQKHSLITHMLSHTGEKPFKCSHCTYSCRQKHSLIHHMCIHTGEKPFQCSQCSYACNKKCNLIGHMRTHTGENPSSACNAVMQSEA